MARCENLSKFQDPQFIRTYLKSEPSKSPRENNILLDFTEKYSILAKNENIIVSKYVNSWQTAFTKTFTENCTAVKILNFEINHQIVNFIAAGFQTGWVKFYLLEGQEIAKKWIAQGEVLAIKENEDSVDFTYKLEFASVSKNELYNFLRTGKASLALQKASNQEYSSLNSDSLPLQKLAFNDEINAVSVTPSKQDTIFDQLLTASIIGGPDAIISPEPMSFEKCQIAKNDSLLNFNVVFPREAPSVSENITVKGVTNLISSFWGSKPVEPEPEIVIEKPLPPSSDKLQQRQNVEDFKRHGQRLVSNGKYSVLSDSLGRVWLVDNKEKCVCRCWKGYRAAQAAFLTNSILAILAPVRNIVEIWPLFGQRIAAFNVAPETHIISTTISLEKQVFLFSMESGELKELRVNEAEINASLCSGEEALFRALKKSVKQHVVTGKNLLELTQKFEKVDRERQKELLDIVITNLPNSTESTLVDLENFVLELDGDYKEIFEKLKLFKNYASCKTVELRKSVNFGENLGFTSFYNNDNDDLSDFIFSGIGDENWKHHDDYCTRDRFYKFICGNMVFENCEPDSILARNLRMYVDIQNVDYSRLSASRNVQNAMIITKLLVSHMEEDLLDSTSEKLRIFYSRAQDTLKLKTLPNIGEEITIGFLGKHSFEEIISKWMAINFEDQIEIPWFSPQNKLRFAGLVSYELAKLYASSQKLNHIVNAVSILKNPTMIRKFENESIGYSTELAELIFRHFFVERVLEINVMIERVGHRPPIGQINFKLVYF